MAKKNTPQTFVNPETGETITVKPKKKKTWLWILLIVVVVIIVAANSGNKSEPSEKTDKSASSAQTSVDAGTKDKTDAAEAEAAPAEAAEAEPSAPDLSNVATEYTLHAGTYTGGIDIPAGRFNVSVVSGNGNVMTSLNSFTEGGVNAVMGVNDDNMHTKTYNGAKIPSGEILYVKGNLVIQIEYTKVESDFTGRQADDANSRELGPGQYITGEDFPEGMYSIEAVSGTGNVQSSGVKEGINEIMGISDDEMYVPRFEHMYLDAGRELKISGVTVRIIPETTP